MRAPRAPFLQAADEAVDVALGRPRSAAGIGLLALIGALVAVFVNPAAAAIVTAALFVVLAAMFVYALRQRSRFDGPYQVLESEARWELSDPRAVVCTRRIVARFNYPTLA